MPPLAEIHYAHRPKPYGQEARFTLFPDRLEVEHGRRKGRFPLAEIALMRCGYAPTNIASDGFETRLFSRDGKTVKFGNLSWRSMAEMDRHDADYLTFVATLAERLAPLGTSFAAGVAPWRYWTMATLGGSTSLLLAAVVLYGLYRSYFPETTVPDRLPGLIGGMAFVTLVYLAFWMLRWLKRNRPRPFAGGLPPADVLPKPPAPKR